MKQGITIRARNIRFTCPATVRVVFAGLLALALGFCPLTASAQAILGAACPGPAGQYSGIGPDVKILICIGGVWTAGFTIDATGKTGIGTTTPTRTLHVYDALMGNFRIGGSATEDIDFDGGADGIFWIGNIGAAGGRTSFTNSSHTELVTILNTGNVGMGTITPGYKLHVVSTGTAWTNASDIRLKDVHGDYEYGLDEVLKLHTVRFNYKKDNPLGLPSDTPMTGFIAQEVQKVIPDAIHENKNGYLDLNADPIHWATVNAVQQLYRLDKASDARLTASVKELKAEIEKQQKKIDALEKTIQHLAP